MCYKEIAIFNSQDDITMKTQVPKQKLVFDLVIPLVVLESSIGTTISLSPFRSVIECLSNLSKKKQLFKLVALSIGPCTTHKILIL